MFILDKLEPLLLGKLVNLNKGHLLWFRLFYRIFGAVVVALTELPEIDNSVASSVTQLDCLDSEYHIPSFILGFPIDCLHSLSFGDHPKSSVGLFQSFAQSNAKGIHLDIVVCAKVHM